MKIFSPHRKKMEASRRYGSKEFQNKIKKAQNYKRVFDPRTRGFIAVVLHKLYLDSILVKLVLLLIVGGSGYYLFFSPYFLVTQVEVANAVQVHTEQAQTIIDEQSNSRWFFIPKNHMIFMSATNLQHLIAEKYPLVKAVNKHKRLWPNKIYLELEERHPGFALSINSKLYLVDEEGLVVKELQDPEGLPLVIDTVIEPVELEERLNNIKMVGFVLSGARTWPSKINSEIKEIRVPGKASTQVQFISSEGWGVFFDVNRSAESQLTNLSTILTRQIPAKERLNLVYIDLRFDKWAYYCYKNSPCEAQEQVPPEDSDAEKVEIKEDEKTGL